MVDKRCRSCIAPAAVTINGHDYCGEHGITAYEVLEKIEVPRTEREKEAA